MMIYHDQFIFSYRDSYHQLLLSIIYDHELSFTNPNYHQLSFNSIDFF